MIDELVPPMCNFMGNPFHSRNDAKLFSVCQPKQTEISPVKREYSVDSFAVSQMHQGRVGKCRQGLVFGRELALDSGADQVSFSTPQNHK